MNEHQSYFSSYYIKVNGQDLPAAQLDWVQSVTVEQNVHLPALCTIVFHDTSPSQGGQGPLHFDLTDQNILPIGAEIDVSMGRDQKPVSIFNGEVTAHDLDIAYGAAPELVVRAYDRAHRLQRGRFSRSFLNMTDGDIAAKIARESGLQPEVDATSQVYDYVFQNNQTNLEFLQERAHRIGYEVYVDGTKLRFVKPHIADDATLKLELWADMLHAHVHMTSAGQVQEVTVRCWDAKAKKTIMGRATTGTATARGGGQQSGADLAKPFGTASMTVTRRPVQSQAEADALAQALADDLAGGAIHLDAEVKGNPLLRPGQMVGLAALGDRFSGQYYVTAATHRTGHDHPYTTAFTVGGRRSGSLLELLAGSTSYNGHGIGAAMAIGIVTNNKDPDGLGRVKVQLPWLADDETDWARVVAPSSGAGRGFYWLPEVNDEVFVAFEHGDVQRPHVIGGLWNSQDKPPKGNSDVVDGSGNVTQRIIKSRSGHTITLDDTSGSGALTIADSSGNNVITIDTASNKITLSAQGDLDLKAGGNVSVQAQGNCTINASGNCDIEATGNAKMSGAQISVEAEATCAVKGAMVTLN